MSHYVLIESRDPFDSRDSEQLYDVAKDLKGRGHDVTFFLIQNGVLPARQGSAYARRLSDLTASKVRVLADVFSLKERGLQREEMLAEVKDSDVGHLVDMLMRDGTKAVWH